MTAPRRARINTCLSSIDGSIIKPSDAYMRRRAFLSYKPWSYSCSDLNVKVSGRSNIAFFRNRG